MSGIPETAAHIERQIDHLILAGEQFTNVEAEAGHAVEEGMLAWKALGAIRQGISMYSQNTEEALTASGEADDALKRAGAILQDPVGSPRIASAEGHLKTANEHLQLAAEKRDVAIATGTIAVKALQTASAGIVGFLNHTESACTHAADTMSELQNAKEEKTGSTPVIQEKIAEAHQETDNYSLILHRARTDIIRYMGNSSEASEAEIAASLFALATKDLEEGVALLEESRHKPIDKFRPAAQTALQKVEVDFVALLEDLYIAIGHHIRIIQGATKGSVSPLIQSALQQSRSLLTRL